MGGLWPENAELSLLTVQTCVIDGIRQNCIVLDCRALLCHDVDCSQWDGSYLATNVQTHSTSPTHSTPQVYPYNRRTDRNFTKDKRMKPNSCDCLSLPTPQCDNLTVVIRFFQESLSFPQFPPLRTSLVIAFSYYLHRNFLTISQFSSNELLHQ